MSEPHPSAGFDNWGRRVTCAECGKRLQHPSPGRPRKRCGARACEAASRRHERARAKL